MKTLGKTAFVILLLISIVAVIASVYFYNVINEDYQVDAPNFGGNPDYRFYLVLADTDSHYTEQIKKGAYAAAMEYNVALEYHKSDITEDGYLNSDYITIARLANVDGVIVNNQSDVNLADAINEAVEADMAVTITGFKDVQSNRNVYVGTSQFEYGREAALLTSKAISGPTFINVAVIQSTNYQEDIAYAENNINLFMTGFDGVINNIEDMRKITVEKTSSQLLGAEDITQKILRDYPQVNVIFCMNSKDTIAAARAVVDRNKVGSVFVVGTDINNEIIEFINKGIVYGVIDRNAYEVGRESIIALINQLEGNLQSSYNGIALKSITKENSGEYIN